MDKTFYGEEKLLVFPAGYRLRTKYNWNVCVIIKMMIISVILCFFGCAHRTPGIYQQTEADFSKTGKIAVIKFNSHEYANASQEASNLLALAFIQKGYGVVEASNVLSSAEQEKLHSGILTPEIKAKFKNNGVGSIVVGSIHEYSCTTNALWLFSLFQMDVYRTYCRVAVSVKMIKLDTGDILWGVSRSEEDAGSDINAGMVLRELIQGLEYEVPVDPTKQPAK